MTSRNKMIRMKRITADRLLEGVIERVKGINADPKYCFDIDRMVVFGSYANSDKEDLSDLDVAVHLKRRYETDDPRWKEACDRYRGKDELMHLYYPIEEIMRTVRNRNGWISVHRIGRDAEQDAIIFADKTIEIDLSS